MREFVRWLPHHVRMATVTLRRSDLFPVGTTVGIYPAGSVQRLHPTPQPPGSAAIASGTVDAAGLLTVTDAGILSLTDYVAAAVGTGSVWQFAKVRSTLDLHDYGAAVGTLTTTNASPNLTLVTPSSGAVAVGQRIMGAGIPAGSYLVSGSGANWVMSAPATASASGVAFTAEGASAPPTVLGSTPRPGAPSTWQARVRQRRNLAGTS